MKTFVSTIKVKNPKIDRFTVRTVIPCNKFGKRGTYFINSSPADAFPCTRNSDGEHDTIELIALIINRDLVSEYLFLTVEFDRNLLNTNKIVQDFNKSITVEFTLQNGSKHSYTPIPSMRKNGKVIQILDSVSILAYLSLHTVITNYINDVFTINFRISNSEIDIKNNVANGKVYIKSIKILFDKAYNIYPFVDRPYLIEPGSITLFDENSVFLPQQGLVRSFSFGLKNKKNSNLFAKHVAKFGQYAFPVGGETWHNNNCYLTQKATLGKITDDFTDWYGNKSYKAALNNLNKDLNFIKAQLLTGSENKDALFWTKKLGPFHPYYYPVEGAPGGDGINHFDGYLLDSLELEYLYTLLESSLDRQRWYTYDLGVIGTIFDWYKNHTVIPFEFRGNGDMQIPAYKNAVPVNSGVCEWESVIESYKNHDFSHLIRLTRLLKTLAQLTNDPFIKDELEIGAENCKLQYHLYDNITQDWSPGSSLKAHLSWVKNNQGKGAKILARDFTWAIDCILSYYLFANSIWRANNLETLNAASDFLKMASMPTGWVQNNLGGVGQFWTVVSNLDPKYSVAQTFENEFIDFLRNGLARSVFYSIDSVRWEQNLNDLITSTKNTHHGNLSPRQGDNSYCPQRFAAVGLNTGEVFSEFQANGGGPECFYGWHQLASAIKAQKDLNYPGNSIFETDIYYLKAKKDDVIKYLMTTAKEYWNDHLHNAIALVGDLQNI